MQRTLFCLAVVGLLNIASHSTVSADDSAIAPPALGEETKGTPAIPEGSPYKPEISSETEQADEDEVVSNSPFGRAKITESRRESGQVYLIELEHSFGSKQYIEETDSDGKIESTSNDIEETPNLPKWKLGSW